MGEIKVMLKNQSVDNTIKKVRRKEFETEVNSRINKD